MSSFLKGFSNIAYSSKHLIEVKELQQYRPQALQFTPRHMRHYA